MAEPQARKRGRPKGPQRTYMSQDSYGNVYHKSLSPHKAPKTASAAAQLSDQLDCTDQAEPAFISSTPQHMDDAVLSPQTSAASEQQQSILEAEAQLDITSYARQLSAFLGPRFKPVLCTEPSDQQACYCLPAWDQRTSTLNVKQFHLPGIRMTAFEDGQHYTWWCDCHHALESARTIFAHQDFPDQPSDWLDGRADKCEHIEALEV